MVNTLTFVGTITDKEALEVVSIIEQLGGTHAVYRTSEMTTIIVYNSKTSLRSKFVPILSEKQPHNVEILF